MTENTPKRPALPDFLAIGSRVCLVKGARASTTSGTLVGTGRDERPSFKNGTTRVSGWIFAIDGKQRFIALITPDLVQAQVDIRQVIAGAPRVAVEPFSLDDETEITAKEMRADGLTPESVRACLQRLRKDDAHVRELYGFTETPQTPSEKDGVDWAKVGNLSKAEIAQAAQLDGIDLDKSQSKVDMVAAYRAAYDAQ